MLVRLNKVVDEDFASQVINGGQANEFTISRDGGSHFAVNSDSSAE